MEKGNELARDKDDSTRFFNWIYMTSFSMFLMQEEDFFTIVEIIQIR